MDNIIFSQNVFSISGEDKSVTIDKNRYISIPDQSLIIYDNSSPLISSAHIHTSNLETCNMCRISEIDGMRLIELISCNFNNINGKFTFNNCEVYIYHNCVMVLNDGIPYTYYYLKGSGLVCKQIENLIYIVNKKYLIKFNILTKVFSHYFVTKYCLTNSALGIICRLPKNLPYYFNFTFNLNNNKVTIKKLKKTATIKEQELPLAVFYLAKNYFENTALFISNNIDKNSLFKYFENYENLYMLSNQYYITSFNKIEKLNIKIQDGIVTDID